MTRPQTSTDVADKLGISRQGLIMLLMRNPDLKPKVQIGRGNFLWSDSEIEAVARHKASHKRGRPAKN